MSPHVSPAEAAGWYSDPEHPGRLRWWDGFAWTAHVQELPPPPVALPAASAAPRPPVDAAYAMGEPALAGVVAPAATAAPAFAPAAAVAPAFAPAAVAAPAFAPAAAFAPTMVAPPAVAAPTPAPTPVAAPAFAVPPSFAIPDTPAAMFASIAAPAAAAPVAAAPVAAAPVAAAPVPAAAVPPAPVAIAAPADVHPPVSPAPPAMRPTVMPPRETAPRDRDGDDVPQQQPLHLPPRIVSSGRLAEIARSRPGTRLGRDSQVGSYVPDRDSEDLPASERDDNDTVDKDDHVGSPLTGEVWFLALLPLFAFVALLIFMQLDAFSHNWYLGWLTLGALVLGSVVVAGMDRSSLKGRNIHERVPAALALVPPVYLVARAAIVSASSAIPLVVWLLSTGTIAGWLVTMRALAWVFPTYVPAIAP